MLMILHKSINCLDNDPALKAAYAELIANKQALPVAVAEMLPKIYGSYQTAGWETNNPYAQFNYNLRNYGFNLNLPLFRSELWANLEQARHAVKLAVATYMNTNQALIYQVAQQYFAILSAIDEVQYTQSKRNTFARELDQAQHRYAVGLIAITDVEDSKSRHDRAVAEEISAQTALANEYDKLQQITGIPVCDVVTLPNTKAIPLNPPMPNEPESWVTTANEMSLDMMRAKENAEKYKAAIGVQAAGHLPTVDIQGLVGRDKQFATPVPLAYFQYQKALTLNINIPLFSGGKVFYKTREAAALYDKALQELEIQQRNTDSTVRQTYRDVLTAISSVSALNQVVSSSESALVATRAAYEVGTRTMVDVLNAETNVFASKRDFAKARYKYLSG